MPNKKCGYRLHTICNILSSVSSVWSTHNLQTFGDNTFSTLYHTKDHMKGGSKICAPGADPSFEKCFGFSTSTCTLIEVSIQLLQYVSYSLLSVQKHRVCGKGLNIYSQTQEFYSAGTTPPGFEYLDPPHDFIIIISSFYIFPQTRISTQTIVSNLQMYYIYRIYSRIFLNKILNVHVMLQFPFIYELKVRSSW